MNTEEDYNTNNYKESRTKIGNFLYNTTDKMASFLIKHMWLYYLLNYTWGSIMTIIGWLTFSFIHIFFKNRIVQIGKSRSCYYIMIGDNWGGLSLGQIFLIADNMGSFWTQHTKYHETGHTFQNAIYGPFAIFLIYIPSFIRYWYQNIRDKKGKSNKPYDLIWFEESATDIGTKQFYNFLKS